MQLYCQCGYPIAVGGRQDGDIYHLVLRDGVRGDGRGTAHDSITRCPHCGGWLQLADLSWQPPISGLSVFGGPQIPPAH